MVTVHLPANLVRLMGMSERTLVVPAATVGEMLTALDQARPGLWDRICEADGSIRQHVNIFVGEYNARTDGGPSLTIPAGAEVWIIPAVSGV